MIKVWSFISSPDAIRTLGHGDSRLAVASTTPARRNPQLFPVLRDRLEEYQRLAEEVAKIWKEHGALAYFEYVGEDLKLEGTRSFPEAVDARADEAIVFGWVVFVVI